MVAAGEAWLRRSSTAVVVLSKSNDLGHSMFGSKIANIVSSAVKAIIDLQLMALCTPSADKKVVEFGAAQLASWRDEILTALAEVEGLDTLPSKRLIDIRYRSGIVPKVPITNMVQDIEYRILAIARGSAIHEGFLPEMAAERMMGFVSTAMDKQLQVDVTIPEMVKAIRHLFVLLF